MEIVISQEEIKDYLKLKILSRLTSFKEKIRIFEKKHSMNFISFEQMVLNSEEKFDLWDDYIEWKANEGFVADLNKELGEIDRAGHIKIIK
jgi:hypothetical protein